MSTLQNGLRSSNFAYVYVLYILMLIYILIEMIR